MRLLLAWVVLPLVAGAACAHVDERAPPPIPTVPLSFESNLAAAVECEYVGQVLGRDALFDAQRRDANLVIEFVIQTSTTSYNGMTVESSAIKGTALKCPPETVHRLVAAARRTQS